jgi:hypothetical protein
MSRRHAVAEAKNRAAEIAAGERTVGFRIDEDKEEEEEEEDDDVCACVCVCVFGVTVW